MQANLMTALYFRPLCFQDFERISLAQILHTKRSLMKHLGYCTDASSGKCEKKLLLFLAPSTHSSASFKNYFRFANNDDFYFFIQLQQQQQQNPFFQSLTRLILCIHKSLRAARCLQHSCLISK